MKTKRLNKRGFTIVELVIVIAVVAVLAAVLIPTFVGLINDANISADSQAVKQMNDAVAIACADKAPENLDELIDILADAKYNSQDKLVPVTANHSFYWYKTHNQIILVNDEDNTIVFPEDDETLNASFAADLAKTGAEQVLFNLEGGYKYVDIAATDATSLSQALLMGNESIKLEADLLLITEVTIPAGANVVLDLNGKTLSTAQTTGRSKYLNVADGATLTIKNGTFNARGVQAYGNLVIEEGATINSVDTNGGAAVWVYAGGEVVINGGTFTSNNIPAGGYTNPLSGPGVINNAGKVVINAGTFESNSPVYMVQNRTEGGEIIINGGTFNGGRGAVGIESGSAVINGGTFVAGDVLASSGSYAVYACEAQVTINGGTFSAPSVKFCVDSSSTSGKITIAAGVDGLIDELVLLPGDRR